MPQNIWDGDVYIRGNLRADGFSLPANSVGDAAVSTLAPIDATKLKHQYAPIFASIHGAAVATMRYVTHVAYAAGTIAYMHAGVVVPATGNSTVVVNLLKNGVSVLSATILLDSTDGAYALNIGTILTAAYTAGSVFEIQVTANVNTGTLPQGLFVQTVFREDPGA
jgi:hypothetical protein